MFVEVDRPDAEDPTFDDVQINGGESDPSHPGYEANLNMQYGPGHGVPDPARLLQHRRCHEILV